MAKLNFLRNKYILYILLFLAVTNILGYLAMRDFDALSLFVATTVVTYYFSKNMIVILGLAILVTALFRGSTPFGTREGLVGEKAASEDEEEEMEEGFTDLQDDEEDDEDERPMGKLDKEPDLGKRIDKAGTMEESYNNLQSILGGGGMEKLTQETKSLIEQQSNLMKQLEGLGPIMKNAKEVMRVMDNSKMHDMIEKFLPSAQAMLQKK